MTETVAIASDHAGYDLKSALVPVLRELGFEVLDLGTHDKTSVDYPDFADKLAHAIRDKQVRSGVLVCGTGIGISIAANRHPEIRCGLCHDATTARLTREHNDANVLALGGQLIGFWTAKDCVETFFKTAYQGGRHEPRVKKLGRKA
jgi:ribose 5-phosphate isomerase B